MIQPNNGRTLAACHNLFKLVATAFGSKYILNRRNQMAAPAWRAIPRLILQALFHKSCGRQRARDDAADVDRATPRFMGRLGMAMHCRKRQQRRDDIRCPHGRGDFL